ncbi:MAG: ATP-binding cassette domain-containing protein [Sulfuricurvum sp.]|uniref:ATP-binding cassette domain-containing protein n=1 Tax=Sulfuricurvum sp. TaxID=2025608 RepID=UPI00261B1D73|nr:ATP-binding cassette domain-containing protein [Sulfuricurvum sp.]MDD2368019.1 ATP-binding cassette domain-containing protein [Sulfuricurvum sp.]MDD2950788.1 ATP-binding cassette domain-containing protein [Sulfuricurvum sp.]MDD5119513.1 ATP-binding cassette domain-containing protein [Sulfuricurvum sp.]
MKTNILELENVSHKYDKAMVLKEVSFFIEEASFFVLLGLNGAGKSTLFSLLTRLQSLQSGSIKINGFIIQNYTKALKDIGIVFQEPTLDLDLTVRQNLYYYGALKGLSFKETIASIKEELTNLELDEKLDTKVQKLNGGHRRRVEIVRSLINKPKLLLLDEATVGLDLKSRFDILDYLRTKVQKGDLSVLWITHLFDEVQESDSLAIIHKGEILATGTAETIIAEYKQADLTQTFRHLTRENPDA